MDSPRQRRAIRHQLWLSIVVTGLLLALAAAVTFAMVLRDDLAMVFRVFISAVMWLWAAWAARDFRKIYVQMKADPSASYLDT